MTVGNVDGISSTYLQHYLVAESGYRNAYICAMMNMVICKLNAADGTATTGDVLIVPAT